MEEEPTNPKISLFAKIAGSFLVSLLPALGYSIIGLIIHVSLFYTWKIPSIFEYPMWFLIGACWLNAGMERIVHFYPIVPVIFIKDYTYTLLAIIALAWETLVIAEQREWIVSPASKIIQTIGYAGIILSVLYGFGKLVFLIRKERKNQKNKAHQK